MRRFVYLILMTSLAVGLMGGCSIKNNGIDDKALSNEVGDDLPGVLSKDKGRLTYTIR